MFPHPRLPVLLLLLFPFASLSPLSAGWREEMAWPEFTAYVGGGYPDGTGVLVVQAEADGSGASGIQYKPDPADGQMSGKTFTDQGAGGGNSNHALNVARRFYGDTDSIAPGITDIHLYDAGSYLDALLLNFIPSDRKVHANAWTGSFPITPATSLATMDSTIHSRGFLVVGGLNNGPGPVPEIMAHSYNALTVGVRSGNHSAGLTSGSYGPGRTKPELVLSETKTSWAVGAISSLAAVLYDAADAGGHTNAEDHSEVMKAILLAGATKQEFSDWDRTTLRPLDEQFGAGEAHLLNSYLILAAGEQTPGAVSSTGWSFQNIVDPPGPNQFLERSYDFSIPADEWAEDFSVVLNWNYEGTGAARDLKLELFSLDGGSVLLDESDSPVDNIEHIYIRHLPSGNYQLKVSRADNDNGSIDFGLAWQSQLGEGPLTLVAEHVSEAPEITVTKIFKDQNYVIERSLDLANWTVVHSFTPTTWADYTWEDPAGFTPGSEVFYRSGWSAP